MLEFFQSMSFREKSLWAQIAIMGYLWVWYFGRVGGGVFNSPLDREETLGLFFGMTIALIVLSIISYIVLVVVSPKDSGVPADERDRLIANKAGNYSSYIMGGGVIMICAYVVINELSAIVMVHALVLLLMAVDIIANALQVFYYRRGH